MAKSIIQNSKHCYVTGSDKNLHKHHIFNGNGLRKWSESQGLWIYLRYDIHENLHDGSGLAYELKRIGQYHFEKYHSRAEFIARTHKNYLTTPLSNYEKEKYHIDPDVLDLSVMDDLDLVLVRTNI